MRPTMDTGARTGYGCPYSHNYKQCITSGCSQPVDCAGAWGLYGQCTKMGTQNKRCRTYKITKYAAHNGYGCPHTNNYELCTTSGCSQQVSCQGSFGAYGRALMTTVITRTSAAESTTLSRMLPMAALAAPTPTTITSAPTAAARSLWTVLVSGVTMVCVPLLELRYLEVGHLETKTQHWTPRTISISWTKTLT